MQRMLIFLLLSYVFAMNTSISNAEKIKLHAPLKGIENPLKVVKYPGAYINYDAERQELVIAGVESVTRGMVERYKDMAKIVRIGTDVRAIDDFAFFDFSNLECVYQKYIGCYGGIENHLQLIGEGAFKNCRKLESIFMINRCGVTILKNAFMDCENLNFVDLNIKCIVPQAFVRCNKLEKHDIAGFDNIFYMGSGAFEDCRFIRGTREKINHRAAIDIWNPIIKRIDFDNSTMMIRGRYFGRYDLLPYFVAMREHGDEDIFVVVADGEIKIDGAYRVSENIWNLDGHKFYLCAETYYNYLNDLYKDRLPGADVRFSMQGSLSPETDSDEE